MMTRRPSFWAARRPTIGNWRRAPRVLWNHSTTGPAGSPNSAYPSRRPSERWNWPSARGFSTRGTSGGCRRRLLSLIGFQSLGALLTNRSRTLPWQPTAFQELARCLRGIQLGVVSLHFGGLGHGEAVETVGDDSNAGKDQKY